MTCEIANYSVTLFEGNKILLLRCLRCYLLQINLLMSHDFLRISGYLDTIYSLGIQTFAQDMVILSVICSWLYDFLMSLRSVGQTNNLLWIIHSLEWPVSIKAYSTCLALIIIYFHLRAIFKFTQARICAWLGFKVFDQRALQLTIVCVIWFVVECSI